MGVDVGLKGLCAAGAVKGDAGMLRAGQCLQGCLGCGQMRLQRCLQGASERTSPHRVAAGMQATRQHENNTEGGLRTLTSSSRSSSTRVRL